MAQQLGLDETASRGTQTLIFCADRVQGTLHRLTSFNGYDDVGDLVAFSADTVHCSLKNRSGKPRITGILRIINMAALEEPRPLYKALSFTTS